MSRLDETEADAILCDWAHCKEKEYLQDVVFGPLMEN